MLARGMRDYDSDYLKQRDEIIDIVRSWFLIYGGNPIETPTIEELKTVQNAYGEEFTKTVYTLEDDTTKDSLFLRYDLTVPLARYVANKGLVSLRRYTIGKVYRRDTVKVTSGRYREFYQADFDIVGEGSDKMVPDVEIVSLLDGILRSLFKDYFVITINYRPLVFMWLELLGYTGEAPRMVCSVLDKLEKWGEEWESKLLNELESNSLKDLGLSGFIKNYKITGDFISPLKNLATLDDDIKRLDIIMSQWILFQTLAKTVGLTCLKFDPFMVRGLDYYTGIIFEATTSKLPSSIAGGGRYDDLIGRLSSKPTPAIGVSIGIDRIASMFKKTFNTPQVLVTTIGLESERFKLCLELRKSGVPCIMLYKGNKLKPQLEYALKQNLPIMVILGKNELESDTVKIKVLSTRKEFTVERSLAPKTLLDLLK